MEKKYHEEERYFHAKKKVVEIRGFYENLVSYVLVNIGLFTINLLTNPNHLWFYWPLLGWGIGLMFHGLKVFNYMPFLGKDWEEQKIKEFMAEDEKSLK